MILVDPSIWADYLRTSDAVLQRLLDFGSVLMHPWVVAELALGHLRQRREVLGLLAGLPIAEVLTAAETLLFVERHGLQGRGIGYVDVQLLAATRLAAESRFWTRDGRSAAAAAELGLAVRADRRGAWLTSTSDRDYPRRRCSISATRNASSNDCPSLSRGSQAVS